MSEQAVAAQNVAMTMDGLVQELMKGNLSAIGVAAIRTNGTPVYFYFDGTGHDGNALMPVINQLVGLYAERKRFAGNAPAANRSYGTH